MKTFIASLDQIRAAMLQDQLTSLAFHAGVACFIYLMLFFGLTQHLTGKLTFILAVDSFILGMTATVAFAFGCLSLCRGLGLKTLGRLGEIVCYALCGGAALLLWAIPYPTVATVAPSLASALLAGLAISMLINVLGLLSGAVSLKSFYSKSLLPSRFR
jgi:hypothetical protein